MKSTTVIDSQMGAPETPWGGASELGIMLRNGVRKYVSGNRARKMR